MCGGRRNRFHGILYVNNMLIVHRFKLNTITGTFATSICLRYEKDLALYQAWCCTRRVHTWSSFVHNQPHPDLPSRHQSTSRDCLAMRGRTLASWLALSSHSNKSRVWLLGKMIQGFLCDVCMFCLCQPWFHPGTLVPSHIDEQFLIALCTGNVLASYSAKIHKQTLISLRNRIQYTVVYRTPKTLVQLEWGGGSLYTVFVYTVYCVYNIIIYY